MAPSQGTDAARTELSAWYDALRPLNVDLVGDFAGKELFGIHGEALLLHCLTEACVDLKDGFQLLHAVYAVERFLLKLKDYGCNFHIVWFEDYRELCSPGTAANDLTTKYLLTRAIIIRHLQKLQLGEAGPDSGAQTTHLCLEFSNLQDSRFEDYLANNALYFFLCLAGRPSGLYSEECGDAHLSIAHELAVDGYSVAFINDIEFVGSKVNCSVVSPSSTWKKLGVCLPEPSHPAESLDAASSKEEIRSAIEKWSPWKDSSELTSREVTALSALSGMAKAPQTSPDAFREWAATYIVHLVLLRQLPLSQRSFTQLQANGQDSKLPLLAEFSKSCLVALGQVPEGLVWDSFDLLDGRLLYLVASRPPRLPPHWAAEAREFAKKLQQITGVDVQASLPAADSAEFSASTETTTMASSSDSECTVLPFSHPVLDSYFQDIKVSPSDELGPEGVPKLLKEMTYWHGARNSVVVKRPPRVKDKWELRSDQKWMATYIQYSASLTNASGKVLEPEIIVVGPDATDRALVSGLKKPKPGKANPSGGKKVKAKSGKELALENAAALKQGKIEAKGNSALLLWEDQCRLFEKELDLVKRYQRVNKYLRGLTIEAQAAVGADISVYACNVLAGMLLKEAPASRARPSITALMWSIIRDLGGQSISPSSAKLAKAFANGLGFPVTFQESSSARPLPYHSVLDRANKPLELEPATVDFQLNHCGPFLERSFDPAPDPRVSGFHPDAWQRKVLDAIDADKSTFVVAPTSAGKTFISFYAMKKVLKLSDDGVLVYVAPTKALVNQIAAEIQARFSKRFKQDAKSIWAIHTRDYRVNNPTGCQVLVTVPDILQIMLMAPTNAENENSWSRRVKRIIFDEVHCIGQADDGVVWEQLLLMAPCPIIALSATVGNPVEFRSWLEETEKNKGHEFEMIVHSTRYSDLRKFFWKPHIAPEFSGLQRVDRLPVPGLDDGSAAAGQFSYVHPIASLLNRARGSIHDLSLEPRDSLSLWAAMVKHQTKEFPVDPSLDPRKAFGKVVRKIDAAEYEAKLKSVLEQWMADKASPFEAVRHELRSDIKVPEFPPEELPKHALGLVMDLHAQGALPAILFNYDRVSCEDIAFQLLDEITAAEEAWKASSPVWKRKMEKFERWQKDGSKLKALQEKTKKAAAKSKGSKDEDGPDDGRADDDPSVLSSFDPKAPLAAFSFADETKFSASEIEQTIWSLRWKKINPKIIAAMRRGIGVHHAGMNHKYRQSVEMLFRKGFLTVVIATGTLALGLNMPCKTVVFYGDSLELTALNYHQAAGRAGRRGFDLLGNVVFAGMSQERVYEIMSARLPDLRGQFPLSTTLALRTLGLLQNTDNSEYAVRALKSLLSQSRLYLGGPADNLTSKYLMRFSIEYLRRQHILDHSGAPLNFAGLVGHLYFTENAVFAFHSLLKEGYFHSLSAEYKQNAEATQLKIVLVLAHIFGRIPIGHVTKSWLKDIDKSPSGVLLPELPDEAHRILQTHNRDTLEVFKGYTTTFVQQHLADEPECRLPFSNLQAGAKGDKTGVEAILKENTLPPTKLRSPFAALSGFDDSFKSIGELCSTVRSGVFLEEYAIPYIPVFPDDTDGKPWNAYLYDFFKHGDMEALIRDNRIDRGDVWFHLKDFSLVLATITTSLRNFMDLEAGDGDLAMLDVKDVEDDWNERAEADEPEDTDPAPDLAKKVATAVAAPVKKLKKKKVVDSWDDDASDDETESTHDQSTMGGVSGTMTPASSAPTAWGVEGELKLPQVLRMFDAVQREFNDKFKKSWS
ncbi:unnamed protein product [Discula destructiva]